MKQFTAAIFLLAFTAGMFSKAVIFLDFYANQKYIAENLCINKARPEINCCGKCQLSKKIHTEENKERQNPNRKYDNKDDIFQGLHEGDSLVKFFTLSIKIYPSTQPGTGVSHPSDIFHPPIG